MNIAWIFTIKIYENNLGSWALGLRRTQASPPLCAMANERKTASVFERSVAFRIFVSHECTGFCISTIYTRNGVSQLWSRYVNRADSTYRYGCLSMMENYRGILFFMWKKKSKTNSFRRSFRFGESVQWHFISFKKR